MGLDVSMDYKLRMAVIYCFADLLQDFLCFADTHFVFNLLKVVVQIATRHIIYH